MKRLFFTIFCVMQIGFILVYPAEALKAAREGLNLWLNVMIPTLLPFLILTGILVQTDQISRLLAPLKKLWKIVLGISPAGAYAVLVGMLCGYPLGAKLASDLYGLHKISKKEALYLTTFCNNPSPAFIITYLCKSCLKDTVPAGMVFASIFSANLICMLFFRFFVYQNATISDSPGFSPEISSRKNILDFSIMNGFETITRLGGYILLFSILAGCIRYYAPFPLLYQYLLLGFTEITSGLPLISVSGLPYMTRILLSAAATASGGLCILAQTKGVLHHDLSILPYFISKCICTFLTAGILYCLISYL